MSAPDQDARLRDHFAAAALTGLLSNVQRYQNEPLTRQAFEIADFMLRERGNQPGKPDSSPVTEPMPKEKRAEVSDGWRDDIRQPDAADRAAAAACDEAWGITAEPVAWIVRTDHFQCGVAEHYETAVRWAEKAAGHIVPLYRAPTLTDDERAAIAFALDAYALINTNNDCRRIAATLRGLLERLGGGE